MAGTCGICRAPAKKRQAVEAALASGTTLREIAGRWRYTRSALSRHRAHTAKALARRAEIREDRLAGDLLARMERLVSEAEKILLEASAAGERRDALMGIHQARETLLALSKLTAEAKAASGEACCTKDRPHHVVIETADDWRAIPPVEVTFTKRPEAAEGVKP